MRVSLRSMLPLQSIMSRKKIFYIVFFSALVLAFFAALAIAVPGYFKPPHSPIGVVQPFSMINQDGKTVTDQVATGKVNAVNFFFTTCRSVCPKMNNNLRPVYDEFKNNPGFLLLSFTSDPERDSAARLKHYADSMQVDTNKWIFLTGRKDSLYALARNSYKIDDPKNYVNNIDDDFIHTQFIALVNKEGEVVGIYDGIKPSEVGQMTVEIRKLLKEQP
jgi:protein SCO1